MNGPSALARAGLMALGLSIFGAVGGCDASPPPQSARRPLSDEWRVESGRFQTDDQATVYLEAGQGDAASVAFLDRPALDFALSARVRIPAGGGLAGLAFFGRDGRSHRALAYDSSTGAIEMYEIAGGDRKTLASQSMRLEPGSEHELRVEVAKDRVIARVDGEQVLEGKGSGSTRAARVGLWGFGPVEARFSAVQLSRTVRPLDVDAIKPLFPRGLSKSGESLRVVHPREGLEVSVAGSPPLGGLESSATFEAAPEGALLVATAIVLADEVDSVVDAALAHEIDVVGLGQTFLFDQPRVYSLGLRGLGPLTLLGAGVQSAFRASDDLRQRLVEPAQGFLDAPPPAAAAEAAGKTALDERALAQTLGRPTSASQDVVAWRQEHDAALAGVVLRAAPGLDSFARFSGDPTRATLSGALSLREHEVRPTLVALRRARLHLTALAPPAGGLEPGYSRLRFWGTGAALDLAARLRGALDARDSAELP